MIPYLDKEDDAHALKPGAQVVKKLVEPLKGSNRNFICY